MVPLFPCHLLVVLGVLLVELKLIIFANGNLLLCYIQPSTWGNQRGELHLSTLSIKKFLAPLRGTPVYKIGELHTIFYLCFLVLLVYLSVFSFVSYTKIPTKLVTLFLLVAAIMGSTENTKSCDFTSHDNKYFSCT